MARLFASILAVVCALPLLGAGPILLVAPSVIVYPLQVNGGNGDREVGSRLALTIATRIASLHQVTVKPVPPSTDRAHYLEAARADGADYYITGYVTPLGAEVSLVEQVVSTQSGIVIFSGTAQILTFGEAGAQGDVLNNAILTHALRDIGNYTAPAASPANAVPTVAPSGAPQADIGKLISGKGRRGRATPAPRNTSGGVVASPSPPTTPPAIIAPLAARSVVTAAPSHDSLPTVPPNTTGSRGPLAAATSAPAAPSVHVIVLGEIGGAADAAARAYAESSFRRAFSAHGVTVVGASGGNASEICKTSHADAVVSALVGTRLAQRNADISLEVIAAECSGATAFRRTVSGRAPGKDDTDTAIDHAVDAAVASYLTPPKRR